MVLDVEDFEAQSSGDIISNKLYNKLESVTNYGLGLDYFATEDLIFSGSFVTDFSASAEGDKEYMSSSSWNIYHVSGGASFTVGKTFMTVGLSYSFASDQIKQLVDLDGGENSRPLNVENISTINMNRIKILFGFNL